MGAYLIGLIAGGISVVVGGSLAAFFLWAAKEMNYPDGIIAISFVTFATVGAIGALVALISAFLLHWAIGLAIVIVLLVALAIAGFIKVAKELYL